MPKLKQEVQWSKLSDAQKIRSIMSAYGYTLGQVARLIGVGFSRLQKIVADDDSFETGNARLKLSSGQRNHLGVLYRDAQSKPVVQSAPSIAGYMSQHIFQGIDSFAAKADTRFLSYLKGNVIAAYIAHYVTFYMGQKPEVFKSITLTVSNAYPKEAAYYGGVLLRNRDKKDKAELGITLSPDNTGYITLHVKLHHGLELLKVYDSLSDSTIRNASAQVVRCLSPGYCIRGKWKLNENCKVIKHGTKRNRNTKRKSGLTGSSSVQSPQGS